MSFQVIKTTKTLSTLGAREGSLARVCSLMQLQVFHYTVTLSAL
uniref:Uncharacterized protein n=1 Tax=Anguilla anguilla TaxID=7936 RepID=A0A0E9WMF0_ANGAN